MAGPVFSLQTNSFGSSGSCNDAVFGNGLWIVVGQNTLGFPHIETSPDGVTWSLAFTDITQSGRGLNAVAYSGSYFVTVGDGGLIYNSPDGTTWTAVSGSPFALNFMFGITYLGGAGWVASGNQNAWFSSSADGSSWGSESAALMNSCGGTFNDGIFFYVVGNDAFSVGVTKASDGISWGTTIGTGTDGGNNGNYDTFHSHYILVGRSGNVVYSSDGVSWTGQTGVLGGNTINGVVWSPDDGLWILGGMSTTMQFSTVFPPSWSNVTTSAIGGTVNNIAYANLQYIACASAGQIALAAASAPPTPTPTQTPTVTPTAQPLYPLAWVQA